MCRKSARVVQELIKLFSTKASNVMWYSFFKIFFFCFYADFWNGILLPCGEYSVAQEVDLPASSTWWCLSTNIWHSTNVATTSSSRSGLTTTTTSTSSPTSTVARTPSRTTNDTSPRLWCTLAASTQRRKATAVEVIPGDAQKKNICLEREIRCQNSGRGRKEGRENGRRNSKKSGWKNEW